MFTYEDLLEVGGNEKDRGAFCYDAVIAFRATKEYRDAVTAEAYYARHNTTIEAYERFLQTVSGRRVPDIFSANHRLKTTFFARLVQQQVQYVLGNGCTMSNNPENKEKLGKDFDFKLQTAAKKAMVGGRSYGFWNLDHLEVFGFADTPNSPGFCPLYGEKTAQLVAGIRYWFKNVGDNTVFRATLYETDGYTEYRKINDEDVEVLRPKRGYIANVVASEALGVESMEYENYGALPIVELFANDTHQSELVGIRECIDCYDLVKSGLADDIDDTSGFYWTLTNTGGMDDVDLAEFVQRLKTVRAAALDGDGDVRAEAHTLDVPTEARKTMLELLRKDIYEDFQALDVNTLSAAAKTTQEIQAAYQAQDNKCADFEYYLLDFVQKILALAGIDDNPTFTWNRVVNLTEQTNMVLSSAQYLAEEMIIKKLPFLTPEEADLVISQREQDADRTFNEGRKKTTKRKANK